MDNFQQQDQNSNEVERDIILKQMKNNLCELEENDKMFERLNRKFIQLQADFNAISEEKTKVETEFKTSLNITSTNLTQLNREFQELRELLETKTKKTKYLLKNFSNLNYILDINGKSLIELKAKISDYLIANRETNNEKKKSENKIIEITQSLNQNKNEISYYNQQSNDLEELIKKEQLEISNLEQERLKLMGVNKEIVFENSNMNENLKQIGSVVSYYQKELNDSNDAIKKMGEMIKKLEEEKDLLQKKVAFVTKENLIKEKKKFELDNNYQEVQRDIDSKSYEINCHLEELKQITIEKDEYFKENTKIISEIDEFQEHIYALSAQNKKIQDFLIKVNSIENKTQGYFEKKEKMTEINNFHQKSIQKELEKHFMQSK